VQCVIHVKHVIHVNHVVDEVLSMAVLTERQNVTISLKKETLQKARVLAARRSTSISGLLAEQIEALVGQDDDYARAEKRARELMKQGFDMGERPKVSRDELHERY